MIPTRNKTNKKFSNTEQSCGVLGNVSSASVGLSYIYISSAVYRSIPCISVFSGLKCMACCCWTNSPQASS